MKIQKILCGIICGILLYHTICFAETPVLSEEPGNAQTAFTYTVEKPLFTVTIPTQIPLSTDLMITSNYMQIRPEQTVVVRIIDGMDENGEVKLYRKDQETELSTFLTLDEQNISSDTIIAKFQTNTDNLLNPIKCSSIKGIKPQTVNAQYTRNITFEIGIE